MGDGFDDPREWTDTEMRRFFCEHVWAMVEWWAVESREPTPRGKLEGLAHSLLSAIDGSAMALPGYVLSPAPHEDDKDYHHRRGENWYPEAPDVECDIAGNLAQDFFRFRPTITPTTANEPEDTPCQP